MSLEFRNQKIVIFYILDLTAIKNRDNVLTVVSSCSSLK